MERTVTWIRSLSTGASPACVKAVGPLCNGRLGWRRGAAVHETWRMPAGRLWVAFFSACFPERARLRFLRFLRYSSARRAVPARLSARWAGPWELRETPLTPS